MGYISTMQFFEKSLGPPISTNLKSFCDEICKDIKKDTLNIKEYLLKAINRQINLQAPLTRYFNSSQKILHEKNNNSLEKVQ